MNRRLALLLLVFVAFSALSAIAVAEHGYLGLWRLPFQHSGTLQLFADLAIEAFLVTVWMLRDARARGVSAVPYLVLTLATGSTGPLLYLIQRERAKLRAAAHTTTVT